MELGVILLLGAVEVEEVKDEVVEEELLKVKDEEVEEVVEVMEEE